ncbi:glycoside hydrolase family 35 protein [Yinghuangia seranimata]|uniref:glycoside hydrolase family 35 protein n=1 Tax=Yinghuangia seranimata TaxID=408067 RepID=UPI00248C9B2C|nr:beta-galactosidase family protein [Yinghuangia seranimata]MDI2125497.1 beta-galactosidase [Yinghuangia seranimata]
MTTTSTTTGLVPHPRGFTLDGRPFRVLSGALHYFRVHPAQWDDRLARLRAMGLNTVETYVAWNRHEPEPGRFDFTGPNDLAGFVRAAARHGLKAIVRPGPYICAEWELGGLPAWLLKDPGMRLRCAHPGYLAAVDRYFDALMPELVPLLAENGGPVIALQVENEYGSYGNDARYLRHLADGLRRRGATGLLFTSDGPTEPMMQGGTLAGVLPTANFGSRAGESFEVLRRWSPDGPPVCMEFWNGWFDHWHEPHHVRDAADAAAVLDEMLAAGASVNLYMAHGGTNFGFMNGANEDAEHGYQPTVTSYDYDAAISEAGELTPKYWAFREVIGRHADLPAAPPPPAPPRLKLGDVRLPHAAPLLAHLDDLSTPVLSPHTLTMEEVDQAYGLILYRTWVSGPREPGPLHLDGLADRAQVFLDGVPVAVLDRSTAGPGGADATAHLPAVPAGGARLDILVENCGRVNYGPGLHDRKGITRGVRLERQNLFSWQIYPLPFIDAPVLPDGAAAALPGTPVLRRGTFEVADPADTFVRLDGWEKGLCWVNGFHLGRYWSAGPQRTLYVPAPVLRRGLNELTVLELHGPGPGLVTLTDTPDLGTEAAAPEV